MSTGHKLNGTTYATAAAVNESNLTVTEVNIDLNEVERSKTRLEADISYVHVAIPNKQRETLEGRTVQSRTFNVEAGKIDNVPFSKVQEFFKTQRITSHFITCQTNLAQ